MAADPNRRLPEWIMADQQERLQRIAGWHERLTGPAGTFDDFCAECDRPWPCDTRRMADGTHPDLVPPPPQPLLNADERGTS